MELANVTIETELATNSTFVRCTSCNETILQEDCYCEQCGFPMKGTDEDQNYFLDERDNKRVALSELNRKVKTGSKTLFALSAFCVVTGIFYYSTSTNSDGSKNLLFAFSVLAALYTGLATWSVKHPLPAIVLGLILYVIVELLSIIENPSYIIQGIIVKVAVVIYLVKGIRSASEAQRIKKEINLV